MDKQITPGQYDSLDLAEASRLFKAPVDRKAATARIGELLGGFTIRHEVI